MRALYRAGYRKKDTSLQEFMDALKDESDSCGGCCWGYEDLRRRANL
ncbi:hypothetical protein [Modicisalibacter xianhensis]|nr:hypothetical protein [Halomonas xianhensis]